MTAKEREAELELNRLRAQRLRKIRSSQPRPSPEEIGRRLREATARHGVPPMKFRD